MIIKENVLLSELTTMRVGGVARYVIELADRNDVVDAVDFANMRSLPIFVLGDGTNVLAPDKYDGVVLLNKIKLFEGIADDAFKIGAGENLDETCAKMATRGLSGMECMSGIPGTVGAAPIQNSGAYGQEVAQVLTEMEAYDLEKREFVTITNEMAGFSYRASIFKNPERRRYVITSVTVKLSHDKQMFDNLYFSIKNYMLDHGLTDTSPSALREVVLALRATKIPSITNTATAGSFFKNPILSGEEAQKWVAEHPEFSYMKVDSRQIRIFAGWLLEMAGLKGYESHGMKLYEKNALIGVNVSAQNLADIDAFTKDVIDRVFVKYGIRLDREPDILG